MYEDYTRQSLPNKQYRELLGSAICVFNSNNSFVIENIMKVSPDLTWYELIDKESGRLMQDVKERISSNTGCSGIGTVYEQLIQMRNRIIHSFQITYDGEQILATKTKAQNGNRQFIITEAYLLDFIKLNQKLSDLLYDFRDRH